LEALAVDNWPELDTGEYTALLEAGNPRFPLAYYLKEYGGIVFPALTILLTAYTFALLGL